MLYYAVVFFVVALIAAVFGFNIPSKFVIFITQSTGTTLETTGQQVTYKGSHDNVAAS